jgi:pimeloyl-ACP methyl ester carboxylesterase
VAPDEYDEFGLFHENAAEYGLPFDKPPDVRRQDVAVEPERMVSALAWGREPSELVLLHGGAQNAHTWDTVALALGRPLLAVDLPGHGHSDGSPAGSGAVVQHASDVARVIDELAPSARAVVGMSLGGLTAIEVARQRPDLVRRLVLVDITPGVNREKAAAVLDFVNGPPTFDSFDEILARTVAHHPSRSVSSLRRGILHNAVQLDDGRWVWRYARFRDATTTELPDSEGLWDVLSSLSVPLMLVRGMAAGSVVDDGDERELKRRQPRARVERVAQAGHSIQGDAPLELAGLIDDFVPRRSPAQS